MSKRKAFEADLEDLKSFHNDERSLEQAGEDYEVAGAIKFLQLENFLCHANLEIKFAPKINFIVGNNGSGKSAILTGIIVCLGAKANDTDRGKSLKDLIKEGKSLATVTLQLWNRGSDAFKPDVYGEFITIQRRLSREGTNGFKIMSARGKTISTRKDELTSICDHMKIQPDNPISILSQETAKKFISATNPRDKYQLFLKATHLSQLASDLSLIEETAKNASEVVEQKRKVLPELQKTAKEAKERYDRLKEAHSQHTRTQDLKNEMVWAHVVEIEQAKEKEKQSLDYHKDCIEKIGQHLAEENVNMEKANRAITELEQRKTAQNEHEAPLKATLKALKNGRQEALAERDNSQRTLDRINKDVKYARLRVRDLENNIKQELIKSQQSSSFNQEQADQRIKGIENEVNELEAGIVEHEIAIQKDDEELNKLAAQKQDADGERRQISNQRSACQKQLQEMHRVKSDRLVAYGPTMPKVLKEITEDKNWQQQPLGPLGLYMELSVPQWSNIVEQLLDKALTSFVVSSHADRQRLNAILQRNRCFSAIYVSNLDSFDYSSGEPDGRYTTILRTLKFKSEIVKRQLIVANKIEKIILVEHRQEGDNIMNRAPHNVIGCYTKEGYQVGLKGGYGTFAMPAFNKAPKLSGFSADQAQALQRKEQYLANEIEAKNDYLNKLQGESGRLNESKRVRVNQIGDSRRKIRSLKAQIAEIQQDLRDHEPANISAMEEMKREQEEALALITTQFEAETDVFLLVDRKIQTLEGQIQETLRQLKEISGHADIYQEKIDEAKKTQGKHEAGIAYYKKKLHSAQESARKSEQSLASISLNLSSTVEKAQIYCPERVPVTKSPAAIAREIEKAERALQQAQSCLGMSLENAQQDLNSKFMVYRNARRDIGKTDAFLKDLNTAWEVRSQRWTQFRQFMAKRTRYSFMYNLSMRNFKGKLEFNHNEQTLSPVVHIGGQDQTVAKNKDPKSLSGGEKSFSTICLLLALWESMECPIRCLDEYDVFMDQANRKVSTSMIIESARKSSKIQYILITPQGMDKESVQQDVHVHVLRDPRKRVE